MSETLPPVPSLQDDTDRSSPDAPSPDDQNSAGSSPVSTRRRLPGWVRESPSWLTSFTVHVTLLVLLAYWIIPIHVPREVTLESLPALSEDDGIEEIQDVEIEEMDELTALSELATTAEVETDLTEVDLAPDEVFDSEPIAMSLDQFAEEVAPMGNLLTEIGASQSSGLGARGAGSRAQMVRRFGGTEGSEAAVANALMWLAAHQNPDGSWSFDHRSGPCSGRCNNPGSYSVARNGATAMALLPFLGAGVTHKEGKYKENVEAGLYYLLKSMKVNGQRGSFHDQGNMYSHGLATIALSEAYAMTEDRGLRDAAQHAINFIHYAQDPRGGGWRYEPRKGGDTSVVGWQVMALKSGYMAYLAIDPNVVRGASTFLDRVQTNRGAGYGYSSPENSKSTSAIGLLCRMYMGWEPDHPALTEGVMAISKYGPASDHLYYDYYATQLLFHYTGGQGPEWEKWNTEMRDILIESQATSGHEKGSWFLAGGHADAGGRLFCTSLATMILEVYYRHLPIYGAQAVEEDFPE